MKIIEKVKKISVLALAVLVLSSLFVIGGASTTAKATTTAPVEFYSSYSNSYYIGSYFTTYVKVNTLGSNQHVYIHAKPISSSVWEDFEGQYVKTLSDGSQIWKVTTDFIGFSIDYAIKYEVNGQTYWNNNNNNNFTIDNKLGAANLVVTPAFSGSTTAAFYPIRVAVKNLGYNKMVNVRYTEDNWATYKDTTLNYQSNNTDGSENWATTLNLNSNTISKFHYAVSYNVNGQIYWDNNFGINYNF